jgi:hypothetical protein
MNSDIEEHTVTSVYRSIMNILEKANLSVLETNVVVSLVKHAHEAALINILSDITSETLESSDDGESKNGK